MITKENLESLKTGDMESFSESINSELKALVSTKLSEKTVEMTDEMFDGEPLEERFIKRVSRFRKKQIRRVKKAPKGSKVVGGRIQHISGQEKINRKIGARQTKRTKLKGGGGLKQRTARKQRISKKLRKTLGVKNPG